MHWTAQGSMPKSWRGPTIVQDVVSSYNLVAEENEARLQMELGHTTPKMLIKHSAIVTPANAQAWWKMTRNE